MILILRSYDTFQMNLLTMTIDFKIDNGKNQILE